MELKIKIISKVLILCVMIIKLDLAAKNELRSTTDCICSDQNATYECTAVGGDFTVWNGSIMDPPGCEISLSHAQFFNDSSCNFVVGKGLEINDGCYTSLLTVLVVPHTNGKNVSCVVDNNYQATIRELVIGTMIVNITTVPFPPPSEIRLITANPTELVFGWSPPSGLCPSLTYSIVTAYCGICQDLTMTNTTTCTNFTLSAVCTMNVSSVICGNLTSSLFSNITVNLTAPDIPGYIEIVPHYSDGDSRLLSVRTQFHTGNRNDGTATNYTITYFDLNSGRICGNATMQRSSCSESCTHIFEICSSTCPPASNISVKVVATNVFGRGPVKTSLAFANGTNNFVDIMLSPTTKRIICIFDNHTQESLKECSVEINTCGKLLDDYNSTIIYRGSGRGVTIQTTRTIKLVEGVSQYCFSATASSMISSTLNQTIVVEGTLNLINFCDSENGGSDAAIIALAIVVVLLVIVPLIAISVTVIIVCFCRTEKKKCCK